MRLFGLFKKKDKKDLEVREYNKTGLVKRILHRSITIDPGSSIKPEEYYDKQSQIFGRAKLAVTVLLIGVIVLAFTVFSDVFSGENFKYLIRHINIDYSVESEDFRDVVFPDNEKAVFGDFRKDFVIAAPGILKLYDYNGGLSINSTPSTQNPKLSISRECILLYDEGDTDFYIYNNFSKLHSDNTADSIIMADMSDSGKFVIVTESSAYAAKISVYNENYIPIRGINRNTPVTAVKLSSNGKYLAMTTVEIEGAECIATLTVYDLEGKGEAVIAENIYNEIPAGVVFENESEEALGVSVITDRAIRKFTTFGEDKSTGISGKEPQLFHISSDKIAYTVKNNVINNTTTLYCISSKDMSVSLEREFDEKIIDLGICGENIYVLTKTKIIKINKEGEAFTVELSQKPIEMVVFSSGEAFVRYSNVFKLVDFD